MLVGLTTGSVALAHRYCCKKTVHSGPPHGDDQAAEVAQKTVWGKKATVGFGSEALLSLIAAVILVVLKEKMGEFRDAALWGAVGNTIVGLIGFCVALHKQRQLEKGPSSRDPAV